MIGKSVLGDGDMEEVGGLEIEGDGDQGLDALNRGGLHPENGERVGIGIGHG